LKEGNIKMKIVKGQGFRLFNANCFSVLKEMVRTDTKVDLIVLDLPYGETNNHWDSKIDLQEMWSYIKQIRRDSCVPIIMFASGMGFMNELYNSNKSWFRYMVPWNKVIATGFLDAATQPLKVFEYGLVFAERLFVYKKSEETYKKFDKVARYYPQMEFGNKNHKTGIKSTKINTGATYNKHKILPDTVRDHVKVSETHDTTFYRDGLKRVEKNSALKHPKNMWKFKRDIVGMWNFQKDKPNKTRKYHPTSKPVSLYEYIIKTYSKEGETVLDFCLGGGNIFTACQNLNRKFIGVELDKDYFEQFIIPKIQVPLEECVIQELEIKGE
jgi:DNA modification methylase